MGEFIFYLLSLFGCMAPVIQHNNIPSLQTILGVAEDASDQEIRRAYLRLAKTVHPDKNPGSPAATATFQRISNAYQTLLDPEKSKLYDEARRDTIIYVWQCSCDERIFD